ncbi:hypothetical protein J6590_041402 [Homalodisca vitripennis]|nr:hypothetical protein J6590_041402 [Homalodisca vitripennis]
MRYCSRQQSRQQNNPLTELNTTCHNTPHSTPPPQLLAEVSSIRNCNGITAYSAVRNPIIAWRDHSIEPGRAGTSLPLLLVRGSRQLLVKLNRS